MKDLDFNHLSVILNIYGVNYRCIIFEMSKNEGLYIPHILFLPAIKMSSKTINIKKKQKKLKNMHEIVII